jgi:hypothetical protein
MRIRIALALLLTAAAAAAQDSPAKPDYSKETLIRVLAASEEPPERESRIRFREGAVEFTALGLDWRFPTVVGPYPGSIRDDVSMGFPDAFSTLGIPIATGPRAVRASRRDVNAELRRIERQERRWRNRGTVVVKPK